MRAYIEEYFDKSHFIYGFNDIKNRVLQLHKDGKSIDEIVKHLQEWIYIFTDKEETEWEKKVVENIINGNKVINRFTGEVLNV
jgi:hypothetical protein